MRHISFGLIIFLGINALALQSRKITASGGAPIPTAFSASDSQSLVWTNLGPHKHIHINNTTSSAIACDFLAGNTTLVPTVTSELMYIPATTQYVFDDFKASKRAYCRSDTGSAITSGDVIIHAY